MNIRLVPILTAQLVLNVMFFFMQYIVIWWNALPRDVVEVDNLTGFKEGLNKFMEDRCMERGGGY